MKRLNLLPNFREPRFDQPLIWKTILEKINRSGNGFVLLPELYDCSRYI